MLYLSHQVYLTCLNGAKDMIKMLERNNEMNVNNKPTEEKTTFCKNVVRKVTHQKSVKKSEFWYRLYVLRFAIYIVKSIFYDDVHGFTIVLDKIRTNYVHNYLYRFWAVLHNLWTLCMMRTYARSTFSTQYLAFGCLTVKCFMTGSVAGSERWAHRPWARGKILLEFLVLWKMTQIWPHTSKNRHSPAKAPWWLQIEFRTDQSSNFELPILCTA